MDTYSSYEELIKPFFAPPAWLFGPVWTVLYIIIAISFGYVFLMYMRRKRLHHPLVKGGRGGISQKREITWLITLPFLLNLIFNFLFTPIQFGLKNNILASIDILLTVGTLIWALLIIFPIKRWVTYVNIPYLLWGLFATTLQISITYLNW